MVLDIFIIFWFVSAYSIIFNFINAEVKVLKLEILICGHGTSPKYQRIFLHCLSGKQLRQKVS